VQHGVGRKGELLSMTEEMLVTMLEDLMTGRSYREQLKQMRCEFVRCDVDRMGGIIERAAQGG